MVQGFVENRDRVEQPVGYVRTVVCQRVDGDVQVVADGEEEIGGQGELEEMGPSRQRQGDTQSSGKNGEKRLMAEKRKKKVGGKR